VHDQAGVADQPPFVVVSRAGIRRKTVPAGDAWPLIEVDTASPVDAADLAAKVIALNLHP
jgi:hypothetical protein